MTTLKTSSIEIYGKKFGTENLSNKACAILSDKIKDKVTENIQAPKLSDCLNLDFLSSIMEDFTSKAIFPENSEIEDDKINLINERAFDMVYSSNMGLSGRPEYYSGYGADSEREMGEKIVKLFGYIKNLGINGEILARNFALMILDIEDLSPTNFLNSLYELERRGWNYKGNFAGNYTDFSYRGLNTIQAGMAAFAGFMTGLGKNENNSIIATKKHKNIFKHSLNEEIIDNFKDYKENDFGKETNLVITFNNIINLLLDRNIPISNNRELTESLIKLFEIKLDPLAGVVDSFTRSDIHRNTSNYRFLEEVSIKGKKKNGKYLIIGFNEEINKVSLIDKNGKIFKVDTSSISKNKKTEQLYSKYDMYRINGVQKYKIGTIYNEDNDGDDENIKLKEFKIGEKYNYNGTECIIIGFIDARGYQKNSNSISGLKLISKDGNEFQQIIDIDALNNKLNRKKHREIYKELLEKGIQKDDVYIAFPNKYKKEESEDESPLYEKYYIGEQIELSNGNKAIINGFRSENKNGVNKIEFIYYIEKNGDKGEIVWYNAGDKYKQITSLDEDKKSSITINIDGEDLNI